MAVWLSLWQTRDHIEATLELLSMKRRIPTWMLGIVFLLGPGWPSECPWVPNRISKMLWESKLTKKTSTFVTLISEENETRNKNPANFFTLQNFLAGELPELNLRTPQAKHTKTSVPKHWSANINLDNSKDYLKHETKKHRNGSILDSGRKKLRKCQTHMPYEGREIPKINNNASTPFPPHPQI